MKGTLDKNSIKSLVEPLKAMSSVLDTQQDGVHVVLESENESIHIGAVNATKTAYAMYELDAKKAIDGYAPAKDEIGIWDVQEFIRVLGNYQNSFYKSNVDIDMVDDVKLNIKCGKDNTQYYTSQLHLIEKGKRALRTDKLNTAVTFTLGGDELAKLRKNMDVFSDLDAVRITGKKGDAELTFRLHAQATSVKTTSNSVVTVDEVTDDIDIVFSTKELKGLLSCNTSFDVTLYTGPKNIGGFCYNKDNYDMKFYLAPMSRDER